MTLGSSRIVASAKRRIRTPFGKRFGRFVPVSVAALVASQVTLIVCLGVLHLTAGLSGALGWVAGASVSYVASRWAWERKGRPHVLKETLPFFAVSVGAGLILTFTAKWANHEAISMGLSHVQRVMFVDAAYFVANCATFLSRFLIFHYVLFVDRDHKDSPPSAGSEDDALPEPGALR
jgi:putative flippase GtrA